MVPRKTLFSFVFATLVYDCFSASPEDDLLSYLGTRTPYRRKYNKYVSEISYPGCKDTKIWMMIRHGTRLPSAKDIIGMGTTLRDLRHEILVGYSAARGELSKDQLDDFQKWFSDVQEEDEKYLTDEGGHEMAALAHRMQKRFPNAIRNEYNNKTFYFRYTATQRAQESAKNFARGLFDKEQAENVVYATPETVDPMLRFYKHCLKWRSQVKKNETTYKEQDLFGVSQMMNDSITRVSQKLGLNRNLTLDEVVLMYKICGYETAWSRDEISPWCYGFDVESAKSLEYYHDLKHYWLDGYGHELTYKQACMAIKNMFENFKNPYPPTSTFLFAHSGTVLKMLSHLQLYKPSEHLRAANMDDRREWRASEIDCFASNLVFVLFKCEDGDKVLTLHQERVVRLPTCETELCPLTHLLDHFHDSVYNCDFSDMCRLDKTEL